MSSELTISRPYAKALFELAQEQSQIAPWFERLQLLADLQENEDVSSVLASPSIEQSEKADLLIALYTKLEQDQHCINLIKLLAENDRLNFFSSIFETYSELKFEFESSIEAEVITAVEVSKDYLKRIQTSLSKRLGKTVSIKQTIDTEILGGAIIKAGDLVIDGSIKGKLNKLTNTLIH
jgi:F-type H+-transporting ATPase subunit delta